MVRTRPTRSAPRSHGRQAAVGGGGGGGAGGGATNVTVNVDGRKIDAYKQLTRGRV
jgi:hypothetical protein